MITGVTIDSTGGVVSAIDQGARVFWSGFGRWAYIVPRAGPARLVPLGMLREMVNLGILRNETKQNDPGHTFLRC